VHTTNYAATFIEVAEDCPVAAAEEPPPGRPTVARLQYELLAAAPYRWTSDDLLVEVAARRTGDDDRDRVRRELFSRPQACLRSSPLAKRYGWGLHSDAEGRVALVPLGSPEYAALAGDGATRHLRAMRSARAR
jgi:hypothetical protein